MEKLQFAPIISVSNEKQKDKSEYLRTQVQQIKSYVETPGS